MRNAEPASVMLAMNRSGWGPTAPLAISAKVVGFQLSERLQATLPESHARIWQRFRPIGPVDAEVRLTFDGDELETGAQRPLAAASRSRIRRSFPISLEQTTGQVTYRACRERHGRSFAARPDRHGRRPAGEDRSGPHAIWPRRSRKGRHGRRCGGRDDASRTSRRLMRPAIAACDYARAGAVGAVASVGVCRSFRRRYSAARTS